MLYKLEGICTFFSKMYLTPTVTEETKELINKAEDAIEAVRISLKQNRKYIP